MVIVENVGCSRSRADTALAAPQRRVTDHAPNSEHDKAPGGFSRLLRLGSLDQTMREGPQRISVCCDGRPDVDTVPKPWLTWTRSPQASSVGVSTTRCWSRAPCGASRHDQHLGDQARRCQWLVSFVGCLLFKLSFDLFLSVVLESRGHLDLVLDHFDHGLSVAASNRSFDHTIEA